MQNLEQIKPLIVGTAGAGGVEVVKTVSEMPSIPVSETVGIISQIIILVATLIGLFKKKPKTNS